MNPYGVSDEIFRATADQNANSFSNPVNIAHLYPGWGNNPMYQTPAYDAPYRPAYQGPNPYAAYDRPSFGRALNQAFSPFNADPYWGNPVDYNRAAFNSIGSKPIDSAAEVTQRFIAPAFVYGAATAMFGKMGANLGRGFASGLTGASASGMIGSAGGLVGNLAFPIAIGAGVMHAVERGVFQPYIRSRQMGEFVNDSFAGVTLGGGLGNVVSGRGMSYGQSAGIGSAVDFMGMNDMTFGANQYNGIASMGMRAGLFDNVNGTGDIIKRVSSIAAQVKTILAISKDPSIQNAIQEIAKLQIGGASISGGAASAAIGAYSHMGMYASAAGTSIQRLMGTVGNQGQYLFQMNGLTPYLGQLAAGNAYASFASAQRMGMLSPAQLARMGGLEGATQSALAGQLGASSTMFNQMGLVNQYMGGGRTQGVVNTVSAFGSLASRNPLSMIGSMTLHGDHFRSNQMMTDGASSAENQAIQMLQAMGKSPGPNGWDPNEIAAVMSNFMTPEQIRAYATMRSAQTNPENVGQMGKAFRAQHQEQLMAVISQEGLWGGMIGSSISAMRRGFKSAYSGIASRTAYRVSEAVGGAVDWVTKTGTDLVFGKTILDSIDDRGDIGLDMDKAWKSVLANDRIERRGKKWSPGPLAADHTDAWHIITKLDKAAREGGPGSDIARKLLHSGFSGKESEELFAQFLASQSDPISRDAYESLNSSMAVYNKVASIARDNITKIDITTVATNEADRAVGDQAMRMMMSDGPLAIAVNRNIDQDQYSALKARIGTGDNRADQVKGLAIARLRARGVKIDEGGSAESIKRAIGQVLDTDKANANRVRDSVSGVDWGSYRAATDKFAAAVDRFDGLINKDRKWTLRETWDNLSGNSGQRETGRVR